MADDKGKGVDNGGSGSSSSSNNSNTGALLQQLVQRYGFVASLANPLAGLALSAAAAGAGGGAESGAASAGGGESGGQDGANTIAAALDTSSPTGVLQSVLANVVGSSGNSSAKGALSPSIRLFLLGFLIAYARSLLDNASSLLRRFFVTTVELSRDQRVPSWLWVEHVFRKVDIGKRLNTFVVESHSYEEDHAIARGQDVPLRIGLPTECELSFFLAPKTGKVYPTFWDALKLRNRSGGKLRRLVRRLRLAVMRLTPFSPHAITYGWLDSYREKATSAYGSDRVVSQLSTLSRSRVPLETFLKHARFVYARDNTSFTKVYVSNPLDREWELVTSRPRRLFSSVLLEGRTQRALLQDIRSFLSKRMRTFYAQRGVPHRRGYLLYGPPGSGKTSSIVAIAGELNLNVYALSLAQKGLDERALLDLANACETPCILLLEDIDAAFSGRTKTASGAGPEGSSKDGLVAGARRDKEGGGSGGPVAPAGPGTAPSTVGQENQVTFSALLQLLDGAASGDNRIVFATTNHIERLDPALIRPGRIDVRVQYFNASRAQAKGLFLRIFTTLSAQELDERLIEARKAAEEAAWRHPHELGGGVGEFHDEKAGGTSTGTAADVSHPAPPKRSASGRLPPIKTDAELEDDIFHPDLVRLAQAFAAQIPERVLSMAQLQGFLIKRAMAAQQAARIRAAQRSSAAAAAAGGGGGGGDADEYRTNKKLVASIQSVLSRPTSNRDAEDDGLVLGVEAESDSEELRQMLVAAQRAVDDIAAFVERGGEGDDEDTGAGVSL